MTRMKSSLARYIAAVALAWPIAAHAESRVRKLHIFHGEDGSNPAAPLLADAAGNLYGTTYGGGAKGNGTVFKLAPDGTETVLYSFRGGNDGSGPFAGPIADAAGNLYGTTYNGGVNDNGTVFKVAPDGTETVLYRFQGNDGALPAAGLIADAAGNLYGTTEFGGANNAGTVFKLAPDGTETVLYSFQGVLDGFEPVAGLIADAAGNLYSTTYAGAGLPGFGVVFKLAPDGTETVLHSFGGVNDGKYPSAGLIADAAGNLYGTTEYGGAQGNGTVFKLAPDGTETVLHSFQAGSDGANPVADLIADAAGNLYGTTAGGGGSILGNGCGTVFKLTPDGDETVLHRFRNRPNGCHPIATLIMDRQGRLYGTTHGSGSGPAPDGAVFRVTP